MTLKEHKKHTVLQKPAGGKFHRSEFAMLGAPCSVIQHLSASLAEELKRDFRMGYVDADHGGGEEKPVFHKRYTDKISHHQLEFDGEPAFRFRALFSDEDVVLINGNHFTASRQIVIINEQKKESLSRKLDRLTDVVMILLDDDMADIHDFVKEAISNHTSLPVLPLKDVKAIAGVIRTAVIESRPVLKGLALAGGESIRMGKDKGAINYHGKAQREYLADLLRDYCRETFISKRPSTTVESQYPFIIDSFMGLGPYGGILSAFRHDPNSAWLSVACDIPMLNRQTLEQLVGERDPSKLATCFHNPETDFPEPLITIWEPRAYPVLLYFLSLGYSCPRKVLINSDVNELELKDPEVLTNVNTPEDYEKMRSMING